MKFEQILKVYWSKGFYYNGVVFNFDANLDFLINNCSGMGRFFKKFFIKRFEWYDINSNRQRPLTAYSQSTQTTINKLFSKINPFKHTIHELMRFHIIRIYAIRSYRGRAQAIGKPSRGQRTWSNAWTAYYSNSVLKKFITLTKKINNARKQPVKIDYRRKKKRVVRRSRPVSMVEKEKIKLNAWF